MTPERPIQALKRRRLLVIEDDYLLADDLARCLEELGAHVVGPAGSVHDALELIANESDIDGALLDINLRGQAVFPVAEALAARRVPFVFTTGYDRVAIPATYAKIPLCSKPTDMLRLATCLADALRRKCELTPYKCCRRFIRPDNRRCAGLLLPHTGKVFARRGDETARKVMRPASKNTKSRELSTG